MTDEEREYSKEELDSLTEELTRSPSYRLAYEDADFLDSDEARPVRLQLELMKPDTFLRRHNVRSTLVVFGSTRIPSPGEANARLEHLLKQQQERPDDDSLRAAVASARTRVKQSRYYAEARKFAGIMSRQFQHEHRRDFVVLTGGGPGIMEAANRGAHDVGARTVGLNITLPQEQVPNPYITPDLCFKFHYFGLRKMHFMLRARALVAFPGGYGTLDELFEALTLIQTRKMRRIPIVLVGKPFWQKAVNFEFLVEEGVIAAADVGLFSLVDSADEAVALLQDYYQGAPP
ncbi:MAG: TIGR00730 family Rossman fold protein [Gammaproteobacteria bacterium]|nr:TIGR00730 family Rossman fold protein [Gammaproteobacteria bacterium]